eukprot:TRINITY_DN32413_c0_g1_i1.p2 TRINITY_DN32413_c0_g1~~TRINITY_DN32413_c0_g1_i1.p2  ORF type:complete len:340 (+),score=80.88 TRINITY_DN32413_c0_g1_i1:61-1080(+)
MSGGIPQWLVDGAKRRLDAAGLPSNFTADGEGGEGELPKGVAGPESVVSRAAAPEAAPRSPTTSPAAAASPAPEQAVPVTPTSVAKEEDAEDAGDSAAAGDEAAPGPQLLGRWLESRLQGAGLPAWESGARSEDATPSPLPPSESPRRPAPESPGRPDSPRSPHGGWRQVAEAVAALHREGATGVAASEVAARRRLAAVAVVARCAELEREEASLRELALAQEELRRRAVLSERRRVARRLAAPAVAGHRPSARFADPEAGVATTPRKRSVALPSGVAAAWRAVRRLYAPVRLQRTEQPRRRADHSHTATYVCCPCVLLLLLWVAMLHLSRNEAKEDAA